MDIKELMSLDGKMFFENCESRKNIIKDVNLLPKEIAEVLIQVLDENAKQIMQTLRTGRSRAQAQPYFNNIATAEIFTCGWLHKLPEAYKKIYKNLNRHNDPRWRLYLELKKEFEDEE
ncbi:MAG: hypothetical protein ACFFFC_00925 [Candidatus Thorarchaeota archaeon]